MSYISVQAKLNTHAKKLGNKTNHNCKHTTIADYKETTFGGTLILTKEQYEKAMALSRKMAKMSAW